MQYSGVPVFNLHGYIYLSSVFFFFPVTVPVRNVMQSADDLQEKADEQFNQDVLAMLGEEETDGWRLREIITAIVVRLLKL